MEPSKPEQVQTAKPRDDEFDVAAELGRCIGEALDLETAQVTTETVAVDGTYLRGFIKLGPLTGQQMRNLRQRMRELESVTPDA